MNEPSSPHRDELERRLHAELRDYSPEAPDHLWEGMASRLPKPERPRRKPAAWFWWTTLGGLLLLAVLAWQYFDGAEAGHPVNTADADLAMNPAGSPERPYNAPMMPDKRASGEERPVQSIASFLQKPAFPRHFDEAGRITIAGRTHLSIAEKMTTEASLLPENPRVANPAAGIPMLPALVRPLSPETPPKMLLLPAAASKPAHRNWEIGALSGFSWLWQTAHQAPHPAGQLNFAEYRKGPAQGWQAGLAIRYRLNSRWRLSANLLRRELVQRSAHSATLRLMDGVCLNPYDPGPKEYEFAYHLHSGGDASSLTVRIAQVDSMNTMPADEPFLLTMQTTRRRVDWVLPLTVQRTFGRGRWQGFAEGGGALNVPGGVSVRVAHFSEACADLCFASDHMPTLTSQERGVFSLSWMLGAGADYRLGRNWSLNASSTLFGQKRQTGLSLHTGINLRF